jgi:hypothetical protein
VFVKLDNKASKMRVNTKTTIDNNIRSRAPQRGHNNSDIGRMAVVGGEEGGEGGE